MAFAQQKERETRQMSPRLNSSGVTRSSLNTILSLLSKRKRKNGTDPLAVELYMHRFVSLTCLSSQLGHSTRFDENSLCISSCKHRGDALQSENIGAVEEKTRVRTQLTRIGGLRPPVRMKSPFHSQARLHRAALFASMRLALAEREREKEDYISIRQPTNDIERERENVNICLLFLTRSEDHN